MSIVEQMRINASLKALEHLLSLCRDGCLMGLGTGSTVRLFIDTVFKKGFSEIFRRSTIVASSIDTALYLLERGVANIESGLPRESIDVYIDSADEVDLRRYMVKGGGGAMLREKVLTMLSSTKIFIIDEEKLAPLIGSRKPIPVEIELYSLPLIKKILTNAGYRYELRYAKNRYGLELTDNGNAIIDIYTGPLEKPKEFEYSIKSLPGVVATGIFEPSDNMIIIVGKHNSIEQM